MTTFAPKSLSTLLGTLRALEAQATLDAHEQDRDPHDVTEELLHSRGIDICELPTFGGEAPASTDGVWSWDRDSLLVGEGPFTDWRIIDR